VPRGELGKLEREGEELRPKSGVRPNYESLHERQSKEIFEEWKAFSREKKLATQRGYGSRKKQASRRRRAGGQLGLQRGGTPGLEGL